MPNIATLKVELDAGHPGTGAYNADDELAAGELNAVNRTLTRDTVTGSEILNATDDSEYGVLTAANKTDWLGLCGIESVDSASGVAKSMEADLFGAGTVTRTSLAAVRSPVASRAVELGLGFIFASHVSQARAYHG